MVNRKNVMVHRTSRREYRAWRAQHKTQQTAGGKWMVLCWALCLETSGLCSWRGLL